MASSSTWLQGSNTLMQTMQSIKSMIVESVTEHHVNTELEGEESSIPVRDWFWLSYRITDSVTYTVYVKKG